MYKLIRNNDKPDLVMFSGRSFLDDGYEHSFLPDYQRTFSGQFAENDKLITELFLREEIWPSACLYISKIELWSKNRLCFPPILHEDEAIIFPIMALSKKTLITKEVYFNRRIRADSIMTSSKDERNVYGVLRVLNETMEFMTRECDSIELEIPIWRNRISQLGLLYLTLCREVGARISWPSVFASIIAAKQFKYPIRLIFAFFPEKIANKFRNLKSISKKI